MVKIVLEIIGLDQDDNFGLVDSSYILTQKSLHGTQTLAQPQIISPDCCPVLWVQRPKKQSFTALLVESGRISTIISFFVADSH